jgi:hypothetical protein
LRISRHQSTCWRTFRWRGHYGFSDTNNEKIQNGNQYLTKNGNCLDVPLGIHDGLVRLAANRNVNLGIANEIQCAITAEEEKFGAMFVVMKV